MNFSAALEALKEGKKVRRPNMRNGHYLFYNLDPKFTSPFNNQIIILVKEDISDWEEYTPRYSSDLLADDWEIIEDHDPKLDATINKKWTELTIQDAKTKLCMHDLMEYAVKNKYALKDGEWVYNPKKYNSHGENNVKFINSDYVVLDSEFDIKLPSLKIDTKLKPGDVYIRNNISPLKSEIYFGKINIEEEETETSEKSTLSEYKKWLQHMVEISDQDRLTCSGEMNFAKAMEYEIRKDVFKECLDMLNINNEI